MFSWPNCSDFLDDDIVNATYIDDTAFSFVTLFLGPAPWGRRAPALFLVDLVCGGVGGGGGGVGMILHMFLAAQLARHLTLILYLFLACDFSIVAFCLLNWFVSCVNILAPGCLPSVCLLLCLLWFCFVWLWLQFVSCDSDSQGSRPRIAWWWTKKFERTSTLRLSLGAETLPSLPPWTFVSDADEKKKGELYII